MLTGDSVNSIFNPAFIDTLYPKSSSYRQTLLGDARATNYGVVRLELIEHLYERIYHQRRELGPDERLWPHRIMGGRQILDVEERGGAFRIKVCRSTPGEDLRDGPLEEEVLDVDLVIAATGYSRTAHVGILKDVWPLLPDAPGGQLAQPSAGTKDHWLVESDTAATEDAPSGKRTCILEATRDYSVRFASNTVAEGSGVWLQGCCEGTHGVSKIPLSFIQPTIKN